MAFFNKRYHPPGTPPGTLKAVPQAADNPPRIRLIDYTPNDISVLENVGLSDYQVSLNRERVTWVHVQGHPTETVLKEIGEAFQLHALALEDILNDGQRPKVEPFDDQLFIVMSMPIMNDSLVEVQQVSIFVSSQYVISFCQGAFAPFQTVIKRLQNPSSRLRLSGADFLLYSLLDEVIDQGFPVLEDFGLQLEDLEEKILQSAANSTLENIHIVKRELILLRRMLWPQREVINQLQREDNTFIQDSTRIYLRDCYDHTIQVMDLLETYREMTGSMLDIYLSSVNNRMNDIMRVLTVISTIFIPMTFIVGLYGMNFDRTSPWNMPELGWAYGYLLVWALMLGVAGLMLMFFRRRGWF